MHVQNGRARPPQSRGPLAAVARDSKAIAKHVGTRLGHAVYLVGASQLEKGSVYS